MVPCKQVRITEIQIHMHLIQDNLLFHLIDRVFVLLGDEIIEINGNSVQGMSHAETIALFKNVREGAIVLKLLRRK